MEGRWKGWLCAALVASGSGCQWFQTTSPNPYVPPNTQTNSYFPKVFGGNKLPSPADAPSATTGATPQNASQVSQQNLKRRDVLPETDVAFADVEVDAAFAEGKTPADRDKLLDSARQKYQHALTNDPKNKGAYVGLAKFYCKLGDHDQAIQSFRTAISLYPKDHQLAFQLSRLCAGFGDWPGSVQAAEYALSLDPQNIIYHKALGYGLAQQEKWDEAFAALLKVMKEPEARYILGRCLMDMNRPEEGRKQIEASIQQDPEYIVARQFLNDIDGTRPLGSDQIRQAGYEEER